MKSTIPIAFLMVLFVANTFANPIEADKPQPPSPPSYSTFPLMPPSQSQDPGQTSDSYSNIDGHKPQVQPARPSSDYTGPVPDSQQMPSTWQQSQQTPTNTKDSKM